MMLRSLSLSISSSLVLIASLFSLNFEKNAAQAQQANEFAQQIRTQLDILTDSSQFEQYQPVLTHIDDVGLNVGESRDWELPVEPNIEYVVAAVCDDDCQNIDLELLENDRVVDADREDGPYPIIVGVTGEHRYTVKVTMHACAVSPCYSGFRLFKLR